MILYLKRVLEPGGEDKMRQIEEEEIEGGEEGGRGGEGGGRGGEGEGRGGKRWRQGQ